MQLHIVVELALELFEIDLGLNQFFDSGEVRVGVNHEEFPAAIEFYVFGVEFEFETGAHFLQDGIRLNARGIACNNKHRGFVVHAS